MPIGFSTRSSRNDWPSALGSSCRPSAPNRLCSANAARSEPPLRQKERDMAIRAIDCTIERRLLINYRIDPEVAQGHLPSPFRPHLVSGWAVGGVCLIRLGGLRPAHLPRSVSLSTENVAHRFSVEWDVAEGTQVGVYIPRRDTDSRLTALAGDRIFPGRHHLARFEVRDAGPDIHITASSRDETLDLSASAQESTALGGELFPSLEDAIDFFRQGARGYSPQGQEGSFAGVHLECPRWDARPVTVDSVRSSMFDDPEAFPTGSCTVDFGLVMRDLPARWVSDGILRSRLALQAGVRHADLGTKG